MLHLASTLLPALSLSQNQSMLIRRPRPCRRPHRPAPRQESLPWLLLVILTAVGGGLGAVKHVRDVYYGHKA